MFDVTRSKVSLLDTEIKIITNSQVLFNLQQSLLELNYTDFLNIESSLITSKKSNITINSSSFYGFINSTFLQMSGGTLQIANASRFDSVMNSDSTSMATFHLTDLDNMTISDT